MSFITNEYDVDDASIKACEDHFRPNLQAAALTLSRLVNWTNANSDGWAYWQKPTAASKRLQEVVYREYLGRTENRQLEHGDLTAAQLRSLYTPIKAFLTRQGVAHAEVFING